MEKEAFSEIERQSRRVSNAIKSHDNVVQKVYNEYKEFLKYNNMGSIENDYESASHIFYAWCALVSVPVFLSKEISVFMNLEKDK